MVQLLAQDIKTKEVLEWKGLHLFHHPLSSCSQKVRIYLNHKGVPWASHIVDILGMENNQPYFMGINPRGLVPTLVHDGMVHIESNDIILHLERAFPDPPLVPEDQIDQIGQLLRHEDDLHMDLRTITVRFLLPPGRAPKSQDEIDVYAATGTGTVHGKEDPEKQHQMAFYRRVLSQGIPNDVVKASVSQFTKEFERLDGILLHQPFLLGEAVSILDFAWIVYVNRLRLCGYPVEALHPNLWLWYDRLAQDPRIGNEIATPPELVAPFNELRAYANANGETLEQICR